MRCFFRTLSFAAALLTLPAAALAGNSAGAGKDSASSASATAEKPDKAEAKICKRLQRSESRMTKRTCLTEAQWKKIENE